MGNGGDACAPSLLVTGRVTVSSNKMTQAANDHSETIYLAREGLVHTR